jgi:hypothetical protein
MSRPSAYGFTTTARSKMNCPDQAYPHVNQYANLNHRIRDLRLYNLLTPITSDYIERSKTNPHESL